MEIARFCGGLGANTYIAYDANARKGIVIDAAKGTAGQVAEFCKANGISVEWIANTHGHFDHTADNAKLASLLKAKIICGKADAGMLKDPAQGFILPFITEKSEADAFFEDEKALAAGSMRLKAIHTPGHTKGSYCLYDEKAGVAFTGDTLFAGTHGRTDFAGGNEDEMRRSLLALSKLPPKTKVYPGHEEETTIAAEQEWMKRGTPQ